MNRTSAIYKMAAAGIFSSVILLATSAATAGIIPPGIYRLLDHGDGSEGPAYGLRVDSINEIFSVELNGVETRLTWNGGATANISGTLNQNTLGGNGGVGSIWTVDYDLTGVVAVGIMGFTATGGTGTLTDPLNNVTNLNGEADGSGFVFAFLADGHRIDGDNDTPVGRGWLLPPGSTDDWIVRAELIPPTPIPEPSTLTLLWLGVSSLFGFRFVHKRRRA